VSTATVSRFVNGAGLVAGSTAQRVEMAVRALGYSPNGIARSLVTKATHTIAFLLPEITNPFFPGLVNAVQLFANEHNYALLLCSTLSDPAKEEQYLKLLQAKQVDGILAVGLRLRRAQIERFALSGIPFVSLDRDIDLPGAPRVHVNHRGGAQLATQHLLALGHRSIAHVTGPPQLRVSRERLAGYRAALTSAGLRGDERLVVFGDFSEDGGYRGIEQLLGKAVEFTAVFAANDLTAIGAIAALKRHGRRVPEDVSVVGFDDIHLAAYTSPALTTIRQPTVEMGRRATEILIEAIRGRPGKRRTANHVFDGKLVVRDSTRPAGGR
jgi:LacI family transcriptional regulator, galactose operon repressor